MKCTRIKKKPKSYLIMYYDHRALLTVHFSNGSIKTTDKLDFTMYKNTDEVNPRKKHRRILVRRFILCTSSTPISDDFFRFSGDLGSAVLSLGC